MQTIKADSTIRLQTKTTKRTIFAGDLVESLSDGKTYRVDSWNPPSTIRVVSQGRRSSEIRGIQEFGLVVVKYEDRFPKEA